MPARVLLGFQTALAQINSTTVKRADAYVSSGSDEDDVALASEMIGEIDNGKNIFPSFTLQTSNLTAYPVMKDIVFDDNVPVQYNLWYKLPSLTDVDASTTLMFDVFVRLHLTVIDSTFRITIYGTMNTFTS